MKNHDITVAIDLGRGNASQTSLHLRLLIRLCEDQCGVSELDVGVRTNAAETDGVNTTDPSSLAPARTHRIRPRTHRHRRHARSPTSSDMWRRAGASPGR
jgi:hypothetical protein